MAVKRSCYFATALRQCEGSPFGQLSQVLGQPTECHASRVWPPVELSLWYAFQQPPGQSHLAIELGQQRLDDGHARMIADHSTHD